MSDGPAPPNGAGRWPRPALPWAIVGVAVAVAVVSVTGWLYVLYNRTEGPGEVLRNFAQRVEQGDCAGAFELMRTSLSEEGLCAQLPVLAESIPADFSIDHVVLGGGSAEVFLSGEATGWLLCRSDGSWLVAGRVGTPPGCA